VKVKGLRGEVCSVECGAGVSNCGWSWEVVFFPFDCYSGCGKWRVLIGWASQREKKIFFFLVCFFHPRLSFFFFVGRGKTRPRGSSLGIDREGEVRGWAGWGGVVEGAGRDEERVSQSASQIVCEDKKGRCGDGSVMCAGPCRTVQDEATR